jgi:hypothetical protein
MRLMVSEAGGKNGFALGLVWVKQQVNTVWIRYRYGMVLVYRVGKGVVFWLKRLLRPFAIAWALYRSDSYWNTPQGLLK